MGLAEDLDYRVRPATAVQRAAQAVVASKAGSRVVSRFLPPLDTFVQRMTRQRQSAPSLIVEIGRASCRERV